MSLHSANLVEVWMVRHGRTADNATARLSGHHDVALDATGERQAAAVGEAMRRELGSEFVLVSSPLSRCLRTAEIIAQGCGYPLDAIAVDDRFIEMDYGEWDRRPLAEVPGEVWADWRSDPHYAAPGGESLAAVTTRVRLALTDWVGRSDGTPLVITSHVSPIKAAVLCALEVGEAVTWRMRLSNASITRFSATLEPDGALGATMVGFNEVPHLDR